MENEENPKKISPIILIVAIIQIIFFIVMVVIIINEINKSNRVEDRDDQPIISLESLSLNEINLPEDYITDLTHSITEAIEFNTPNFSTTGSSASIRNDSISLVEFTSQGFNALNFIIDIPNLKQSYQVYYKYPSDLNIDSPFYNNPRAVLCIDDKSQIIYPEFNCFSSYSSDIRHKIATDYINFLEFDYFTISIDSRDSHQIIINPVAADITDITGEAYIAQTKSALSSLGVSPDIFKYRVQKHQDLDYTIPPSDR